MFIGDETVFKDILSDCKCIDFLVITEDVDKENTYNIKTSNGNELELNLQLDEILKLIKTVSDEDLYLPEDILSVFLDDIIVLNREHVVIVEDDYISFKDGIKIENFCESKEILIESYQLPVQLLDYIVI